MDRRKYLKIIGVGTLSSSVLLDACKQPGDVKNTVTEKVEASASSTSDGRQAPHVSPKKLNIIKKLPHTHFLQSMKWLLLPSLLTSSFPKMR